VLRSGPRNLPLIYLPHFSIVFVQLTVTVLVSFWLDRCRDMPSLPEALDGLLALAQHQPLEAAADTIVHGFVARLLSRNRCSHSAPNMHVLILAYCMLPAQCL